MHAVLSAQRRAAPTFDSSRRSADLVQDGPTCLLRTLVWAAFLCTPFHQLASVAGAVIQATGRLTFEDGLRSFVEVPGPKGASCIRIRG